MKRTTLIEFNKWLEKPEDVTLEFKKAKNSFSESKDLPDYCAALANEGGGTLVLGVVESAPHKVAGTKAFDGTYTKLSHKLYNKLHQNIF